MNSRGLEVGVAAGALSVAALVTWSIASSRLLTFIAGAAVGLRLAEVMRAREGVVATDEKPASPGIDVVSGLREAYRSGSERWARREATT